MTATHGVGTYGNAVGTVTPLDHKMAQLGLIVKTAANTIRGGVFWDGNSTIVSGKANMSYDVRALAAALSRSATAGAVLLTNDSVYNVLTTAAPGSNSRYDVVYLWQREYSLDGTDSNPVIGVIQGTAAASPTVPSLAAFPGAIALAQILVPAGVTATNTGTTITQTAPFTTVDGGVVVARTTTERDLYVPASTDLKAQCFVLADGITYKWSGSVWQSVKRNYANAINTTTATGAAVTGSSIVIPRQTFAQRVIVRFAGSISGTTSGGLTVTATTGGTITSNMPVIVTSGSGVAYAGATIVDIAAGLGTAVTIAANASGAGTSTFGGALTADVFAAGEY